MDKMSEWSHVLTIEKSEYSDEGKWLIEGVVAGPNFVDEAGDEFLPDALNMIADHINQNPIPLMDWHGKSAINTIRDAELGEVHRAWVGDDGLLRIEAELDKDHDTARWLRKKTDPNLLPEGKEPKKFGLSVKGVAQNVRPILEAGKFKRQIADLVPNEVSLTTRPYFQPSLGTVISKAIDEAAEAESVSAGDKSKMANDAPKADETTVEVETKEVSVMNAADIDPKKVEPVNPDINLEDAAADDIVGVVVVEKSEEDRVKEIVTSLEDSIRNIVRQEIGNSKVEPVVPSAASESTEVVVEKSEDDRLTIIEKAVLEMGANLERVLEVVPETRAPGVLIAKSEIDEAKQALAEMSPSERIREGFRLTERSLR